jgi:hypothetical protein
VTGVRVVIEDDPRAGGPWFCPIPAGKVSMGVTSKALFLVEAEQLARWEAARAEWERMQGEMREHLEARDRELLVLIARSASLAAAREAEQHLQPRRRRRS